MPWIGSGSKPGISAGEGQETVEEVPQAVRRFKHLAAHKDQLKQGTANIYIEPSEGYKSRCQRVGYDGRTYAALFNEAGLKLALFFCSFCEVRQSLII